MRRFDAKGIEGFLADAFDDAAKTERLAKVAGSLRTLMKHLKNYVDRVERSLRRAPEPGLARLALSWYGDQRTQLGTVLVDDWSARA